MCCGSAFSGNGSKINLNQQVMLLPIGKTSNITGAEQECIDCVAEFGEEYCNCSQGTTVQDTSKVADTIRSGATLLGGVLSYFSPTAEPTETKDSSNNLIIGGIIFLAVVLGIYIYVKNKK